MAPSNLASHPSCNHGSHSQETEAMPPNVIWKHRRGVDSLDQSGASRPKGLDTSQTTLLQMHAGKASAGIQEETGSDGRGDKMAPQAARSSSRPARNGGNSRYRSSPRSDRTSSRAGHFKTQCKKMPLI